MAVFQPVLTGFGGSTIFAMVLYFEGFALQDGRTYIPEIFF
jgi:hypothetical protein